MKEIIKLREELYSLLNSFWDEFERTRTTSMCYTEIQWARAWLGKMLGYLGKKSPYAELDGNRKGKDDIAPPSDAKSNIQFAIDPESQIEKADYLREWFKSKTQVIQENFKDQGAIEYKNVITYLSNARMALGFYLAEIKDKK